MPYHLQKNKHVDLGQIPFWAVEHVKEYFIVIKDKLGKYLLNLDLSYSSRFILFIGAS